MQTQPKSLKLQNNPRFHNINVRQQEQRSESESKYEIPSKAKKQRFLKDSSISVQKSKPGNHGKHWTLKQNISYKKFLQKNIDLLESDIIDRRVMKINVLMSQQIKRKTPNQCRSHHQKMMKRHQTITEIIKFVQRLQHNHSRLKIKSRTKEGGLRILKDDSIQQMNEKTMERESSMKVHNLPQIELPSQKESFTQQSIYLRQIDVNMFHQDCQIFPEPFQYRLWWDGQEI